MKQPTSFTDLVNQFERQEQHVLQLVKIIASTNKRVIDLTQSVDELKKSSLLIKSSLAKILARSHEKKSSSQLLFFICSISFKKMSISGMINYGKPFKRNRLLRCMDMANILKKIFGDGNQRQL